MLRRLLISLIILQMKLFPMEDFTTGHGVVRAESPPQPSEAVVDSAQFVANGNSADTQPLAHFMELQQSIRSPDQTTKVSSYLQNNKTAQGSSSYGQDDAEKASIFLKELQTGLPESKDDVVPFKATADYLNRMPLMEEGLKNETYNERFVYMPIGGSDIIPCIENLNLISTVKSITHAWTDNQGRNVLSRKASRLKVDERYRLSITDAQADDVGVYHCYLAVVYTGDEEGLNIDNAVSLNIYTVPDLALEFPFVFDSKTCDKDRDKKKLAAIRNTLCPATPCVYEFEMTCSTDPWLHTNMPYIPHSKLMILATKYSDPDYKPPDCSRDCLMGNKFGHLLSNLEKVKKAIDMTTNDSNLTYFSGLTMLNRKLVYSCNAGFSLYRESCVPCFPGSYNPKKRMNLCLPCPINTYMEQPGARDCLQCEIGYKTEAVGADSIQKCVNKELRIIQFRRTFYILCGVVGGILGVILAIFFVKMGDRIKNFFIPAETPLKTSESTKLLTASQKELREKSQPNDAKKLSATILQSETRGGSRERLEKRPGERNEVTGQGVDNKKASKDAVFNPTVHRLSKDLIVQPKVTTDITTGVIKLSTAEHPTSQPEGKTKSLGIPVTQPGQGIFGHSIHRMASIAAEFTLPMFNVKPKVSKLALLPTQQSPRRGSMLAAQPSLYDLARATQIRMQQSEESLESSIIPADDKIASHEPSNVQKPTTSTVQPNLPSINLPNQQALPLAVRSDKPQTMQVYAPSDTSKPGPVIQMQRLDQLGPSNAIPVGRIQQPPDQLGPFNTIPVGRIQQPPDQLGPSNTIPVIQIQALDQLDPSNAEHIPNSRINSLPSAQQQQTQINLEQVAASLPQLAANNHTQTLQTVAFTQSNKNASAAAGQTQQKVLSNNLNQNSAFISDYYSHELFRRKGLKVIYAEQDHSAEDQASRVQHLAQLSPPHYLYDEIFWMPNDVTAAAAASSDAKIPSTGHSNASYDTRQGPSNASVAKDYSRVSGSQWNQNRGQQNKTSSYALQDPRKSQSMYSLQNPRSWPGYQNSRQQVYKGNTGKHEQ